MSSLEAPIRKLEVSAYVVPTDYPESDGTFTWDKTTLVLVEAVAGNMRGLGFTYADRATALFIEQTLASVVTGKDAMSVPEAWQAMVAAIRNLGRPGVASMAISAVDAALWDLKARLLGLPLVTLLGAARERVPLYGSGGFTSYPEARLGAQLAGWAERDFTRVKMKIGRDAKADLSRVRLARSAIGPSVELFVDANGAYGRKQALAQAEAFADSGVTWFEEPVSSDDLDGLHVLRDRAPAGMDITAGEYGYDLFYFRRMLDAGAVDVLQADASRCGGITGFLQVAALCDAHCVRLSGHCAPALHAHVACSALAVCHLEYFHDHARIERMFFDGALEPRRGALEPDRSRPGMGLTLKRSDAARFAI
jgi:L-alanine-DL-glutamate epimerase-like enolase superfamily enzyme